MANADKPEMTTIGHRPSAVAHLKSANGTYVQCRLSNGEDAWAPLTELFALFERDLLAKIQSQGPTTHNL